MSALCQKQTLARLLDNLVGGAEHRLRYGQVERFRGFEVDGELDFRGLMHRQVGRLLAVEDSTSIDADEAIGVGKVRSVAHQPTGRDKLTQGNGSSAYQGVPRAQQTYSADYRSMDLHR